MSKEEDYLKQVEGESNEEKDENKEGYPSYPESEDIYENYKKKSDLDLSDPSETKDDLTTNVVRKKPLDKKHKLTGKDLDVPGPDLDEDQEDTEIEDEEN